MLSLCPHPPLGKETGDSSAGKNGPEMVPREAQPGSAGGGGCGGGVPGWRPTGLLLRKRPWRGPVALQLSRPPVFSPGLVGWLPSWVSLQQQNQGQSSWLSLHFPTVCLRLSCPSISLSLSPESNPSFLPLSSFLSLVSRSQYGDPKLFLRRPHPLFTSPELSRGGEQFWSSIVAMDRTESESGKWGPVNPEQEEAQLQLEAACPALIHLSWFASEAGSLLCGVFFGCSELLHPPSRLGEIQGEESGCGLGQRLVVSWDSWSRLCSVSPCAYPSP